MNLLKTIPIILYLCLENLLILPCHAQGDVSGTVGTGGACKGSQISTNNVQNCQCDTSQRPPCKSCDLKSCASHTHSGLDTCYVGCTDANRLCDSCYLWFDQLCVCLQTGCPTRKSTSTNSEWVLMNGKLGLLVTTTELMPGIRELWVEDPWTWGQEKWKRGSEALAINSVRTRSQEQIHMHICSVNDDAQKWLTNLDHTKYQTMTKIPGRDWQCRVGQQPGDSVHDMTDLTQRALFSGSWCPDFIGAAVIVDNKDRIWACLTTDEKDTTEFVFCH